MENSEIKISVTYLDENGKIISFINDREKREKLPEYSGDYTYSLHEKILKESDAKTIWNWPKYYSVVPNNPETVVTYKQLVYDHIFKPLNQKSK